MRNPFSTNAKSGEVREDPENQLRMIAVDPMNQYPPMTSAIDCKAHTKACSAFASAEREA
jgi:hypothetical protein